MRFTVPKNNSWKSNLRYTVYISEIYENAQKWNKAATGKTRYDQKPTPTKVDLIYGRRHGEDWFANLAESNFWLVFSRSTYHSLVAVNFGNRTCLVKLVELSNIHNKEPHRNF